MINMQRILARHFGDLRDFTDGMRELAKKDATELDYNTLTAPGFGTTSLIYTTIALAKEVARLQAIIDNVNDALKP